MSEKEVKLCGLEGERNLLCQIGENQGIRYHITKLIFAKGECDSSKATRDKLGL